MITPRKARRIKRNVMGFCFYHSTTILITSTAIGEILKHMSMRPAGA
jgi:hypothetical protein